MTEMTEVYRYRILNRGWWAVLVVFSASAIFLAVLNIFLLKPFGFMLIENAYHYWLIALYVSLVFIVFPASKSSPRHKIPWYDYFLFFLCFGTSVYFASSALEITGKGWAFIAPLLPTLLSVCLWFMVIEAVRRTSGIVLAIVCGFFSFYPLFAGYMPGLLEGIPFSFLATARYHTMSTASMFGIPTQTVGSLLIGFMVFGVALQATGGGKFFLDFALSLMGKARGGPAKVSVISSALFGTMSGSVISNVLVDGPYTIPAMIKTGYPAHYAAAIEATTSTGGALMPPIMGASAFIMASFLGIPYLKVVVCAVVPSLLYYAGLFFQIHAFALRTGLKGLPESEVPSLWVTMKQGWFFFVALVALIVLVFFLGNEAHAPFYAMAILFLCAMVRKETRLSGRGFLEFIADSGRSMAELTAILTGVGLVIGTMSMTGIGHSISYELVALAGGNLFLLLLMGAFASFILGMGMTSSACYIFLAITLAPALVGLGLNAIAVHLFVLYWGLVSFITPPVALGAITAASIAGANPMRTGYAAMRLGSVIYFVPFFFVLNPALILIGSPTDILFSVTTALAGVYLLSSGLEGYMIGIGKIGFLSRVLIGVSGVALAVPWRIFEAAGVFVLGVTVAYSFWKKRKMNQQTTEQLR